MAMAVTFTSVDRSIKYRSNDLDNIHKKSTGRNNWQVQICQQRCITDMSRKSWITFASSTYQIRQLWICEKPFANPKCLAEAISEISFLLKSLEEIARDVSSSLGFPWTIFWESCWGPRYTNVSQCNPRGPLHWLRKQTINGQPLSCAAPLHVCSSSQGYKISCTCASRTCLLGI